MNDTLNVGTVFQCDRLFDENVTNIYNVVWTQTVMGCKIVHLLQEIYKFNISYVTQHFGQNVAITSFIARDGLTYPQENDNIDIYARPMSLRPELLDYSYPVQALHKWRFGFLVRRPEPACLFQPFYSKPFTQSLWFCLYGMAVIITLLLCILKKWEAHTFGYIPEQGVTYEALIVFGAFCQHIPPLHAILLSRRTVYFVFFMFTYVIYSFYTSNLLSHLVNDKDSGMNLKDLTKSKHELAVVSDFKMFGDYNTSSSSWDRKSTIDKKLRNIKRVTISEGLEGVKSGKTALLSDYVSLYPYVKEKYNKDVLCELTMVNLITDIKKYLFTSKNFKYKEQFKIGTLWAFETGVLKRLVAGNLNLVPLNCEATRLVQAQILQISSLLSLLIGFYVLSVIILIGERIHVNRNRWPYVD